MKAYIDYQTFIHSQEKKTTFLRRSKYSRMVESRLTKRIFKYLDGIKTTTGWLKEVERDLKESENREKFYR